jgi:streptogramin lyase
MVIIIAVAVSMIPEDLRKDQGSSNNGSGTLNQEKVSTDNNKVANNTTSFNSPYITEYKLSNNTLPNGILVDSKGTVWTVGSQSRSLIAFTREEEKIKSYPLPNNGNGPSALTWAMAENKDGSIWFSGSAGNPIWRFDPRTENFESIKSPSAAPIQMKVDENGNVWYTTLSRGVIGVVIQNGGGEGDQKYISKELDLGNESFPSGLYLQNKSLWITKSLDGKIADFQISSSLQNGRSMLNFTQVAEFPRQETLFSPTAIVVGNGSAWVTEHGTTFLTEYNLKTYEVKRYPTALHPIQVSTLPYWLAADTNRKSVWFNEHKGNRIAFFDFSNRTLTEYEVPTRNPQMGDTANVLTVSADPTNENRAWFTELTEDKIGYVDKSKPIPFDIRALEKQIVLEKGHTARVNIEVTRNSDALLFNNTISFGTSSSTIASGVLLNATANFSPKVVDLSKVNGMQAVTLELKDEGIQKGQYILAVSATDGAVIRTVYLEMVVK